MRIEIDLERRLLWVTFSPLKPHKHRKWGTIMNKRGAQRQSFFQYYDLNLLDRDRRSTAAESKAERG